MTKSKLRKNVKATGSHHFDPETMEFFGDTMANYGVRTATIKGAEVWELYRSYPVRNGLHNSAYFSKQTFKKVSNQQPKE